jgi:hypothetical protein
MGEKRKAHKILEGNPEEGLSLEISRRRWEDDVKMYLT